MGKGSEKTPRQPQSRFHRAAVKCTAVMLLSDTAMNPVGVAHSDSSSQLGQLLPRNAGIGDFWESLH